MKRKAQVQMGESIAIIIIITFLIVLSFIFYSKVKEQDISSSESLFKELDLVEMAQIASSIPEVQCSFIEVSDSSCLDVLKVEALSKIVENSFLGNDKTVFYYYRELFGRGKISIKEIRLDGSINEWILYETDNASLSLNTINVPISLYNPLDDERSFGVLEVNKFS
jgi:hypothetical protein